MRSFLAALRTLVLPYGATTGPRIILDGVRGVIKVIGSLGNSIEMDPATDPPIIRFLSPDGTKFAFINSPPGGGIPELGLNTAAWNSALLGQDLVTRLFLRSNDGGSVFEVVNAAQAQRGGQVFISPDAAKMSVLNSTGVFVGHVLIDSTSLYAQWKTGPRLVMDQARWWLVSGVDANKYMWWDQTTGYQELSATLGGTWTGPTFFNSWANPNPANDLFNPGAKISPDGWVKFRGTMEGGTTTDNTKIATFPAPFRPSKSVVMSIGAAGSATRVLMNSLGEMYCYGVSAGSSIGLDGCQFSKI